MANVKISDLTAANSVSSGDKFEVSTADGTRQVTSDQIATFAQIGALRVSNNLSDLSDKSSSRTNLGLGSAAVENVATFAQAANNLSDLSSANTALDNIGLVPIDGTADLATPAVVTRFRNLQGGKLYTGDFGIKTDASVSQAVKFQSFIDACVGERCEAVIAAAASSANGIDLDGATIFLNVGGAEAGTPLHGFGMRGENRRYSILKNGVISVGTVFAFGADGNASAYGYLSDFYLVGSLHCWSLEAASMLSNLRIVGNGLAPSYADDKPGVDWDLSLLVYGCNQTQLQRVRVENDGTHDGIVIDGSANIMMLGGGANLCKRGVVSMDTGINGSATNNTNLQLQAVHFEGNKEECIVIESADNVTIRGNHIRTNQTSVGTDPTIRIGDSASGPTLVQAVDVSGNWMRGGLTGDDTAIDIQRANGVTIGDNFFWTYDTAVNANTGLADFVTLGNGSSDTNTYSSVTTKIVRSTVAKRAREIAENQATITLNTTTPAWDTDFSKRAKLSLVAAGKTIPNPTNVVVGDTYQLLITKSNIANSITTWGDQFAFDGAAPTFLNMTTSQFAVLTIRAVDPRASGTAVLVTSYVIADNASPKDTPTFTVATLPAAASWGGATAYVTDGDASLAWGDTVVNTGSGATPYLVWSNGTNWTVTGK